ncbi:MAG: hypothetical protein COX36_01285 [Candidatus Nealsonbacteria bacterium CG23_combo_of_CG06-09_8_20_14_all_38_19]|uniref:Uncharacterized protein n=1 Tax=Candidatus Nealsonbacteria bacterium CG23_combo_of_CG06-09_8_20_14_all_38_19 TaxID=1974721 RepID=A0A2G9YX21_9BACT|nr:MAG: hypothetical protein COX36_01285 [Candidatus Nealsonbacteria bacterium CG23_combo_of_CG06-09_8_20_14_all_38_19]
MVTIKVIIFVYILIGIFRAILLFLQPPTNRPIAVVKLKLSYILFGIIMWFPLLVLRIINYGIKTTWRWEIKTIKNVFTR